MYRSQERALVRSPNKTEANYILNEFEKIIKVCLEYQASINAALQKAANNLRYFAHMLLNHNYDISQVHVLTKIKSRFENRRLKKQNTISVLLEYHVPQDIIRYVINQFIPYELNKSHANKEK
jgi:hypothetical protein